MIIYIYLQSSYFGNSDFFPLRSENVQYGGNQVIKQAWCYPLEAAISNFIILEVKTSEKGGYSVTFSIR